MTWQHSIRHSTGSIDLRHSTNSIRWPAYGWPPYAISAMPYVGDGLFRPAVNHYTDTAISNDLSRLTLDHYSAAAAVHPQPTGLAPGPGVVPTLLHQVK